MKLFQLFLFFITGLSAAEYPDIKTLKQDLFVPSLEIGEPSAGKRVKLQLPYFKDTELFHILYLPKNWQPGKKYPLIVEYAGNGPYKNKFGDTSSGEVDSSVLGFGLSKGEDFIWLYLPCVNENRNANQTQWWGDIDETVKYCKSTVMNICKKYGADKETIILCGFSRGSIACNFIGLYDDEIAGLWKGFICYSHYDGVRKWGCNGSDRPLTIQT